MRHSHSYSRLADPVREGNVFCASPLILGGSFRLSLARSSLLIQSQQADRIITDKLQQSDLRLTTIAIISRTTNDRLGSFPVREDIIFIRLVLLLPL